MFDAIAGFIDKKFGGKELPTEVLIKKKCTSFSLIAFRLGFASFSFVCLLHIVLRISRFEFR